MTSTPTIWTPAANSVPENRARDEMMLSRRSTSLRSRPAAPPRPLPRLRAGLDVVEGSRILGEAITVYVGVYCTLQWWFYRQMRERSERRDDGDA